MRVRFVSSDERLLATVDALRSQVGQVCRNSVAPRRRCETSESRLHAMLEAALDAVVTMDASGARRSAGNRGRELTFGYPVSEVL